MKKIITILLCVFMIIGGAAAAYAAAPADGTYSVAVSVSGGTGRATISSPVSLTVSGGEMKAKVVWSSGNYTWMKVNGVQYNNENIGGNSTFTIPVAALDTPIPVSAETVAMSEPHVIDYTLSFSSAGVSMKDNNSSQSSSSSQNQGGNQQDKPSVSGKDNSISQSGSSQTNDDNQQSESPSDDEKDEKHQNSDVIFVDNKYNSSTSVSAELLSEYEGKTLRISTIRGEVLFDEEATSYIASKAKGGVTLTTEDVTDNYKDYALAIDIKIKDESGNELFLDGESGKAFVKLKFDKDTEKDEMPKVYKISGENKEEITANYNENEGVISFDTESFCIYGVSLESEDSGSVIIVIASLAVLAAGALTAIIFFRKRKVK